MEGSGTDGIRIDAARVLGRLMFIPRVIYGAMVLSLAAYGLVAGLVARQGHQGGPGAHAPVDVSWLAPALAVAGALTVALIPWARRRLMPPARVDGVGPGAAPAAEISPPLAVRTLGRYLTAQVVAWSMAESLAIYGLVLSLVSYDLRFYLGFGAASLVTLLLCRPRREQVRELLRAAASAPPPG